MLGQGNTWVGWTQLTIKLTWGIVVEEAERCGDEWLEHLTVYTSGTSNAAFVVSQASQITNNKNPWTVKNPCKNFWQKMWLDFYNIYHVVSRTAGCIKELQFKPLKHLHLIFYQVIWIVMYNFISFIFQIGHLLRINHMPYFPKLYSMHLSDIKNFLFLKRKISWNLLIRPILLCQYYLGVYFSCLH